MPCVPRKAVFSAFLFLIASASTLADSPLDDGNSSVVGNSLNGRTFGIGFSFDSGQQVTLPDGTVFAASIQRGVVKTLTDDKSVVTKGAPGGTLTVKDSVGKLLILEIESAKPLSTGSVIYRFWRQDSALTTAMKAVCPDENGQPSYGMLLPNRWDERTGGRINGGYTFACPGGALYKCAVAGYDPWYQERVELHQACTRLIRADYCGDGRSHTREGTRIYFGGDSLGIHSMKVLGGRIFEAAWTTEGASCMGIAGTNVSPFLLVKRWSDLWRRHMCLIPFCPKTIVTAGSGADFLLISACEPTDDEPNKCASPENPAQP